eukprot:3412556-Alexandrium_andersonii.AAC.1
MARSPFGAGGGDCQLAVPRRGGGYARRSWRPSPGALGPARGPPRAGGGMAQGPRQVRPPVSHAGG